MFDFVPPTDLVKPDAEGASTCGITSTLSEPLDTLESRLPSELLPRSGSLSPQGSLSPSDSGSLGSSTSSLDSLELLPDLDPFPPDRPNPFLKCGRGRPGSVIVEGAPGIGKTSSLLVLLVERLHASRPTVWVDDPRFCILFTEPTENHTGVQKLSLVKHSYDSLQAIIPTSAWILSDSNAVLNNPPHDLIKIGRFLVQAASPRKERGRWLKKTNNAGLNHWVMKPWTLDEIIIGNEMREDPVPIDHLHTFLAKYGPSARDAYAMLTRQRFEAYHGRLLTAIKSLEYETLRSLLDNHGGALELASDLPLTIITIVPGPTRRFHSTYTIPTRTITELLIENLRERKMDRVAQLFDMFTRNTSTAPAAGWILDIHLHALLNPDQPFPARELRTERAVSRIHWAPGPLGSLDISAAELLPPESANPTSGSDSPLPRIPYEVNTLVELVSGYYEPNSRSRATCDPFIYDAKAARAIVFQVTVVSSHSVKAKGFQWLQKLGVREFWYVLVTSRGRDTVAVDLVVGEEVDAVVARKFHIAIGVEDFKRRISSPYSSESSRSSSEHE
ncbi:hypothetical protein BXZ70DRAFT_907635 [Cristinia sonorae]|uniref:Uncharacterized protein n=1 Tax=Cristinia sonorae TaxID=1940300 RepID=A0A8K0UMG2_9AGAR|nr:hypothetical protein BXZ70DRAFT_907635 [Cristinia sonorae]